MKQNINLYRGAANQQDFWSGPKSIGLVWLLVAGVLAATQWHFNHANALQRSTIETLRLQAEDLEAQLNSATAAKMAGTDSGLETELNEALRALNVSEKIAAMLKGNSAGDVNGFSTILRSLARQNAAGIWLTHVKVSAPDGRTTLAGRALSPEAVPVYLRQLSSEAALAGQRFDIFQLERDDDTTQHGAVRFALNRHDRPVELP